MRSLSTTLLLLGLCVVAAPSLRASTCTDTTSTTCFTHADNTLPVGLSGGHNLTDIGDSLTYGSSNTITATAWATDLSPNNMFQSAALQEYDTFGLGVCSKIIIATCSASPQHAIDNAQGSSGIFDFVLLQFSQPVTSVSLVLNPFGMANQEMDYTYFAGSCASCTPAGQTLLNLASVPGFGGNLSTGGGSLNSGGTTSDKSTGTLNLGTNSSVNWILIGASTSGTFDDFFKLESVSYTSAVPEPATLGLAGAALVALGLLRGRKALSANS